MQKIAEPGAKMYFIAVVLPEHINEKILRYKKQMREVYGCKVGLKSPAHITIAPPFWMEEEKEQALVQDMESIATNVPLFTLTTANFSAFKPRTIFVAVEENEMLHQLKKQSDIFFRGKDYKIKIENRPFHPHITIATRDLHKKDFWEAWQQFEKDRFVETAAVTGLSLLKHNGQQWDVMFTAPFAPPSEAGRSEKS
ncbi:MAG TPA: RNA 2',3'-cyclic phosphodiesterase [Flavisolibacter sp.]|jgi:2'-5' RNA ligase|nr:RNA 2',3'-cyclic phosphodiesterase [Flavisolibacter sp.]